MIRVVGTPCDQSEPALPDAEVEGNMISTLIDGSGACSSTLCPRYPQTRGFHMAPSYAAVPSTEVSDNQLVFP